MTILNLSSNKITIKIKLLFFSYNFTNTGYVKVPNSIFIFKLESEYTEIMFECKFFIYSVLRERENNKYLWTRYTCDTACCLSPIGQDRSEVKKMIDEDWKRFG